MPYGDANRSSVTRCKPAAVHAAKDYAWANGPAGVLSTSLAQAWTLPPDYRDLDHKYAEPCRIRFHAKSAKAPKPLAALTSSCETRPSRISGRANDTTDRELLPFGQHALGTRNSKYLLASFQNRTASAALKRRVAFDSIDLETTGSFEPGSATAFAVMAGALR